jgi:hypothetical protein
MVPVYVTDYVSFPHLCKTDNLYQKNLFYRSLLFIENKYLFYFDFLLKNNSFISL